MPKIVDHAQFSEELLSKAFGIFARKGFHRVSIRKLAAELEVSTGTLYHYFSSKNDFFDQMVRHLAKGDIQEVLSLISEETLPQNRVRVILEYVSSKEEYFQNLLFLLFDFYRDRQENDEGTNGHSTATLFMESVRSYREAIAESLGDLDQGTGQLFLSLLIGTLVQRIVDPKALALLEIRPFAEYLSGLS